MCPVSIFPLYSAEVAQHGQRRRTEAPIPQGFVGSNPTLRTTNIHVFCTAQSNIMAFHIWQSVTRMPISIRYNFTQCFSVSVQEAFAWCTDFGSDDNMLMGDGTAERQITHIADGVLILKDYFHVVGGTIEKQKLLNLLPDQYKWTSTHLAGPNKYSQFL